MAVKRNAIPQANLIKTVIIVIGISILIIITIIRTGLLKEVILHLHRVVLLAQVRRVEREVAEYPDLPVSLKDYIVHLK